jgi:hypothetical protein
VNDDATADDTEQTTTDDATTATPSGAPRRRVRWWQVALLVVAVGLASAAFGFMTTRQSDRDDAASELRGERTTVAIDRRDAATAQQQLDDARTRNQPKVDRLNAVMATARSLAGIAPQGVDASRNIQQLALDNATGELNSTALPHSDDLAHQWTDIENTFAMQISTLTTG